MKFLYSYIEFLFILTKNVKNEDLIIMVLNKQTKCDHLVKLIGKYIDELSFIVE